jgi:hypothetical protein
MRIIPKLLAETNLTPIGGQTAQRDRLLMVGFDQATLLYNGTFNRSGVWCSDDFILQSTLDWSREAGEPGMPVDRSMPPDAFSLHACGLLCANQSRYVSPVPAGLPIVLNLETGIWDDRSTTAKLRTLWQYLSDSINAIKLYCPSSPVGVFFWPVFDQAWDPSLTSTPEFQAFSEAIDFVCPEFYTHPANGQTLADVQSAWLASSSAWNLKISQYFPDKAKLAFLNPNYAVNGDQGATWNALQGTPVDPELWSFQSQWTLRNGFSVLLWASNSPDPVSDSQIASLFSAKESTSVPSYLSLPDSPDTAEFAYSNSGSLGISTALDVRIKCSLNSWTAAGIQRLCGKRSSSLSSWGMYLMDSVLYFIYFLADGSNNQIGIPISYPSGITKWIRGTVDVTAAKYRVFDSNDGITWNTLLDTDASFSSNLNDAANPLTVGQEATDFPRHMQGKIYYFDVRGEIDGPVLAQADFSGLAPGSTSFNDGQGHTWTLFGGASIQKEVPAIIRAPNWRRNRRPYRKISGYNFRT